MQRSAIEGSRRHEGPSIALRSIEATFYILALRNSVLLSSEFLRLESGRRIVKGRAQPASQRARNAPETKSAFGVV